MKLSPTYLSYKVVVRSHCANKERGGGISAAFFLAVGIPYLSTEKVLGKAKSRALICFSRNVNMAGWRIWTINLLHSVHIREILVLVYAGLWGIRDGGSLLS